ncbi:MAG: hypothetical protein ACOYL5_02310 [Phototrophicaceae bacterium]|jgi:hypothetical protein
MFPITAETAAMLALAEVLHRQQRRIARAKAKYAETGDERYLSDAKFEDSIVYIIASVSLWEQYSLWHVAFILEDENGNPISRDPDLEMCVDCWTGETFYCGVPL